LHVTWIAALEEVDLAVAASCLVYCSALSGVAPPSDDFQRDALRLYEEMFRPRADRTVRRSAAK
jgi:hypothetical protein